jgi:flavin-dependent dehydrogenase
MGNDGQEHDVTVIGAGLAGMAASIHLANAGLIVLCIEAELAANDPVGESLDWSAPALLDALGLPMQDLLDRGFATFKRHVVLQLRDGSEQHYVPGAWLGKSPFNVNLDTIHVDRTMLNQALREMVLAKAVTLVPDKVVRVETSGQRVDAIVTAKGDRIASRWFLDASGSGSSLFPKRFESPVYEYGPHKVAMWDYFPVDQAIDGTTLHANGTGQYMDWVWQIPIHPHSVSVGYVSPGSSIKEKRQQGMSLQEIFQAELERYPNLQRLGGRKPNAPRTTSFRCRGYSKISGPNWLVAGEAAAMVDPMTSNGVTAAMRHAAEASSILIRAGKRKDLPFLPRAMYTMRIVGLTKFFNGAIEKVLYEQPIRNRIGAFNAGDVYTIPAWSINVIYSRLQPRGVLKTLLFSGLLGVLRFAVHVLYRVCARFQGPSEAIA